MSDAQDMKRLLLPLLKGAPFIAILFVVTIIVVGRLVMFQKPVYEATTRVKIDNSDIGKSESNLYKDFDVLVSKSDVLTEVELLKSDLMLQKTFSRLDFDIDYFRIGDLRTAELYHESPFFLEYEILDSSIQDKEIPFNIVSKDTFNIQLNGQWITGLFNQPQTSSSLNFTAKLNKNWIRSHDSGLIDSYLIRLNSFKGFKRNFLKKNLFVKEIDKDIPIIRITFEAEVPEKVALLVNTLAQTYIDDFVEDKTVAARHLLDFIDTRIRTIEKELKRSESALENYKRDNKLSTSKQAIEVNIKEISQLKSQRTQLQLKVEGLDSLFNYVDRHRNDISDLAPNFEAYGGIIYSEMIKQIKTLQAQREDLLSKYTPEHEELLIINKKLEIAFEYIKESIDRHRSSLRLELSDIENLLSASRDEQALLPRQETQLRTLERDFNLYQKLYNFLMEKRTEASIASSANISFHRIIEQAYVPSKPIAPKRLFTVVISAFLSLVISITLVYVRHFLRAKVTSRIQLERLSAIPVIGVIRKIGRVTKPHKYDIADLASQILLKPIEGNCRTIVCTSTLHSEGKTFVAVELAEAIALTGRTVCAIDLNLHKPDLHNGMLSERMPGIREFIREDIPLESILQETGISKLRMISAGAEIGTPSTYLNHQSLHEKLALIQDEFDVVIIDTPGVALSADAITLMKIADHSLYITRAGFTSTRFVTNADILMREHGLNNMELVLNYAHRATNYSGLYSGSRFSYQTIKAGFWNKIRHYYEYYF